jgi:hypothetical protein
MALHFSTGNAKLNKNTLIFNLPAGKTCPGADTCRSMALQTPSGRKIVDFKTTTFRCFAASSEVQYDAVYANRAENWMEVKSYLHNGNLAEFINTEMHKNLKKKHTRVRIHESGDFFSQEYLMAWIIVAQTNPNLKFYCYSKSLEFFLGLTLPANFYLTASYGGKWDSLIDIGAFPRYAKVVNSVEDANILGLQVDVDERHCFTPEPFAILLHGTQPKGSEAGKAARINRTVKKELREALGV